MYIHYLVDHLVFASWRVPAAPESEELEKWSVPAAPASEREKWHVPAVPVVVGVVVVVVVVVLQRLCSPNPSEEE